MKHKTQVLRRVLRRMWRKFIFSSSSPLVAPRTRQRLAMILAERKSGPFSLEGDGLDPEQLGSEAVFIHVPKAGGISIRNTLESTAKFRVFPSHQQHLAGVGRYRIILNHLSLGQLINRGVLRPEVLESSFVFSVVREPYSRAVSLFYYFRRQGVIPRSWAFETFLHVVGRSRPRPGLAKAARFSQAAPQSAWFLDLPERVEVRTYKLESLPELATELESRFGSPMNFEWTNRTFKSEVDHVWSEEAISLVKRIYREDFTIFDYSPKAPLVGHRLIS